MGRLSHFRLPERMRQCRLVASTCQRQHWTRFSSRQETRPQRLRRLLRLSAFRLSCWLPSSNPPILATVEDRAVILSF